MKNIPDQFTAVFWTADWLRFLGSTILLCYFQAREAMPILVGTFIDVIDLATCPDRIHAQRASQQKKGLVTLFEKHTHEDLGFAARSVVFFCQAANQISSPFAGFKKLKYDI